MSLQRAGHFVAWASAITIAVATGFGQDSSKKPSSYMPVVVPEDFAAVMARMKAAKPGVMKRQLALLEERQP